MELNIDWWKILPPALSMLWKLWPFWLLLLALLVMRLVFELLDIEIQNWTLRRRFRDGESWRKGRDLIKYLRTMSPGDFERYIADLFTRLGYRSAAVGGSHDGGVDVVIEKDGVKSYVQCKKYITSRVGVSEVRDFYGSLADRLAEGKGYFITTNSFTLEAEKFAEDKPIELVDQHVLLRYIKLAQEEGDESDKAEVCPNCGGNIIIRRNSKTGDRFYGCSGFPKCRYTKSLD